MSVTGWGGVTLTVELGLGANPADPDAPPSGTGTWGVGVWGTDDWGDGPIYTDITAYVLGVDISSSFSYEMDKYQTGRLSMTLDNADGRFSTDNSSSPYWLFGQTTIAPLREIRVTASYQGVSWPEFAGRIDSWDESLDMAGGSISVTALDYFADFSAWTGLPTAPVGAGENFRQRCNRILTAAGWTGPKTVDYGKSFHQATDLAGSAVAQLETAAAAEGGAIWVDGAGTLRCENRDALIKKVRSRVKQLSFVNHDMADTDILYESDSVGTAYDATTVVNVASYQRNGGTVQTATSQTSRDLYGNRVNSTSNLDNTTDADVLILATQAVAINQFPERRVESLTFEPMRQPTEVQIDNAWKAISGQGTSLRSLVWFSHLSPQGFNVDRWLYVRGRKVRITPTDWSISLDFTSATVWHTLIDSQWNVARWNESRWAVNGFNV